MVLNKLKSGIVRYRYRRDSSKIDIPNINRIPIVISYRHRGCELESKLYVDLQVSKIKKKANFIRKQMYSFLKTGDADMR